MNLDEIINHLKSGKQLSPHTLAEYKVILAGGYSYNVGLMEDILKRRPTVWNELRVNVKSDKATDRAYEGTEDGLRLMSLQLRNKGIEKMISAISSLLRVAEGEAKAQW